MADCSFRFNDYVWSVVDTLFSEWAKVIRLLQWFFWHTSCRGNPASHGIFYVGDIWKGAVDADSNTYLRDWACRNTHAAQKNYLTVWFYGEISGYMVIYSSKNQRSINMEDIAGKPKKTARILHCFLKCGAMDITFATDLLTNGKRKLSLPKANSSLLLAILRKNLIWRLA